MASQTLTSVLGWSYQSEDEALEERRGHWPSETSRCCYFDIISMQFTNPFACFFSFFGHHYGPQRHSIDSIAYRASAVVLVPGGRLCPDDCAGAAPTCSQGLGVYWVYYIYTILIHFTCIYYMTSLYHMIWFTLMNIYCSICSWWEGHRTKHVSLSPTEPIWPVDDLVERLV